MGLAVPVAQENKLYPRDLSQYGRFRVALKDLATGDPAVEGITTSAGG